MPKIKDPTVNVSCRIPKRQFSHLKSIGRPGTMVASMVDNFFIVKTNEGNMDEGTVISAPDNSRILTSRDKDQISLTVIKDDQVIVLDYDKKSASHLIIKLNNIINQIG